jgi:hypothetical protein
MKIHNVRYGFATNSSSSHSVVLAPGLSDQDNHYGLGFGWEQFVLASAEAKRRYLFTAAFLHHYNDMSNEEAAMLAGSAFSADQRDIDIASGAEDMHDTDCYIDHQSRPSFPKPRDPKVGMRPLWALLDREIAQSDKVAILGGNDNDDNESWKPNAARCAPEIAIWRDLQNAGGCVYGIDPATGHFTLFNKQTGKKLRFLPEGVKAPESSAAPELVDIKITDHCPVGCSYCYQGSTVSGLHGDTSEIEQFASYVGNMGVFEVAIGGGDPTTHPGFIRILRAFHRNGVVPNFSTQLWDWLDDPKVVEAVKECCGAVALSTQSPTHAKRWFDRMEEVGIKAHVHYVLGLSPLENLKKMFAADERGHIVLLAHKAMGRAQGSTPIDYTGWQDVVRKHNKKWWTVAVDSFLVDDVRDGFTRDEVPGHLFEASDGRFSFYWDAVEGSYAAHSFKPQSERIIYGEKSADKVSEAWMKLSGSNHEVSIWGR